MSRYGIDYYGASYYGANTLVDFSAFPFLALPNDYNVIKLTWTVPTGEWDNIRLVRNSFGFPVDADDGDVLFEEVKAVARDTYMDAGQTPAFIGLKESHPYYYNIFVRETLYSTWQSAGIAIGVSIKNYKTLTQMYNYLPTILTSQVPYDSSVEQDNDVLKRFLKLFSFSLDTYKSFADNIHNRYNISDVNGLLIPTFMKQFGMKYEPELGLKQSRIFLRNAAHLYQTRGSALGIEDYVKTYGGYDNTVTKGKNLMLDYNDSSFEETIGSWASVSNATLLQVATNPDAAVPAYEEVLSQVNFPNLQAGIMKVTSVGSGTVEIALSGDTPRQYGIPVTAGSDYTLTGWSIAATTVRNVSAAIAWYDKTGVLLSTSSFGTSVANSLVTWTRSAKTATAPTDAYYAVPHFKIVSASSAEDHYFDAVQFELGNNATYYQDARQILINLKATRVNELLNPNFEDNTDNWTFPYDRLTVALNSNEEELPLGDNVTPISGGYLEATAKVADTYPVVESSIFPVLPGNDYTFSIYIAANPVDSEAYASSPFVANLYVSWYDADQNPVSSTYPEPFNIETAWTRPFFTFQAPAGDTTGYGTAKFASVGLYWHATNTTDEVLLDCALFEKSSFLNSFFDGSTGVANPTDLFWEGDVVNGARSHYYRNRFAVQSRLIRTLPDWITLGSTFELLLAQPD